MRQRDYWGIQPCCQQVEVRAHASSVWGSWVAIQWAQRCVWASSEDIHKLLPQVSRSRPCVWSQTPLWSQQHHHPVARWCRRSWSPWFKVSWVGSGQDHPSCFCHQHGWSDGGTVWSLINPKLTESVGNSSFLSCTEMGLLNNPLFLLWTCIFHSQSWMSSWAC